MKKVVFVSTFTGYDKDRPIYYPGTDGFFLFGMGQFIAQEFKKRNYPIIFEIWRMDLRIETVMEKEIDGVLCRIFPSKKTWLFDEMSEQIKKAFRKSNKEKDVIFHFIPNHRKNYFYLANIIRKKTIVATHIGGPNPYWAYKNEKKWKFYIWYILEKYLLLKPFNSFIAISKEEVLYYKKVKKNILHIPFFGISRENLFTIKDKTEAKIKLGLPLNKKILLQVGRAIDARGFDWIMHLIDHYKSKKDYFLLFVGVDKEDEYYDRLNQKSVSIISYIDQTLLGDYFNAADILYYLPHGKMDLAFAGTSYVPLEALACGTPVVASTLHHFPGNDVGKVSRRPKCKEDVIPMIEDLLNAEVSRQLCRDVVLKEFSWDKVIEKHWEKYNV